MCCATGAHQPVRVGLPRSGSRGKGPIGRWAYWWRSTNRTSLAARRPHSSPRSAKIATWTTPARFFAFNQGRIARGVADLLDGVCTLIFYDRLYHLLCRYLTGLVGRNQELKAPYERVVITVPEDCRSMFVTFSKGQPVERDDILS